MKLIGLSHFFVGVMFSRLIGRSMGYSPYLGPTKRIKPLSQPIQRLLGTRRSLNASDSSYNGASGPCFKLSLTDADGLEQLGGSLAALLHKGDTIFLHGDLGAGKTTLSRGFVRAKMGDEDMPVTSPSYLLDNTYAYYTGVEADTSDITTIHHMDLYRLPDKAFDGAMLGIPGIFDTSLCLIEWPERLKSRDKPQRWLDCEIRIDEDDNESRHVVLRPMGGWGDEDGRIAALERVLE